MKLGKLYLIMIVHLGKWIDESEKESAIYTKLKVGTN